MITLFKKSGTNKHQLVEPDLPINFDIFVQDLGEDTAKVISKHVISDIGSRLTWILPPRHPLLPP